MSVSDEVLCIRIIPISEDLIGQRVEGLLERREVQVEVLHNGRTGIPRGVTLVGIDLSVLRVSRGN